MKKVVSLVLAAVMLVVCTLPTNATTSKVPPETMRYVNIANATVSLTVNSSGSATIILKASGEANVTSIKATTYLEQKVGSSWMRVNLGTSSNTWTYTVNSKSLTKSYTKQLSANEEYRAVVTYTMVSSTTTESVTKIDYS